MMYFITCLFLLFCGGLNRFSCILVLIYILGNLTTGNPSAVLNDERKLKSIIKEILQEENYWQEDPKVTDTLMFAFGRVIWFKISSFGRDQKQE